MPDNFESEIVFEASEALKTFKILETVIKSYSQAMQDNIAVTSKFNKGQQSIDNILKNAEKVAEAASRGIEKLAKAERDAAKATRDRAQATKDARTLDARRVAVSASRQIQVGVDRSVAPVPQLVNFDKSIADFQRLVISTGTGSAEINKILNNLSAAYSGNSRKIRDSLARIFQAQARLGGDENIKRANLFLGNTENNVKKTDKAAQNLLLSWKSVVRIFAGQLIFRSTSALLNNIGQSISRARELQIKLAEIQTIAPPDLRLAPLANVQELTSQVSNAFGIDQIEVARAAYEGFSNQIGSTEEVFRFLNVAAIFSKGTVTDLANSMDLLSTTVNAYGLNVNSATRISDIFFKTIDLGRVRGDELAKTLGQVSPLAAQVGLSIEEVAASMATLTIQGLSAEEASTQIRNVLLKLIRPSTELKNALNELGIANVQVGLKTFGFVGLLEKLNSTTNGSIEEIATLFQRVRALQGVIGLGAKGGELYAKNLRKITDESEGASKAAAKLILDTPAAQLQKSIETFKNTLTSEFGNEAINVFNKIIEGMGGAEVAARGLTRILGFTIQAVDVLFGAFFRGLGVLIRLTGKNKSEFAALRSEIAESKKVSEQLLKDQLTADERAQRGKDKVTDSRIKTGLEAVAKLQQANKSERDSAVSFQNFVTENLKSQVNARIKLIDQFVNSVKNATETARNNIRKNLNDLRDFEFGINQSRFETKLSAEQDPEKQSELLRRRVNQLIEAQQKAAQNPENVGFAKRLNDEALSTARQLANLRGFNREGEITTNKVLEARQKLTGDLNNKEREKLRLSKENQASLIEQQTRAKQLQERFDAINKILDKPDLSAAKRQKATDEQLVISKELQKVFSNFGKGTGLDKTTEKTRDQLNKITQLFESLSGKPVTLNFAVEQALKEAQGKISKVRFSASLELVLQQQFNIAAGPDALAEIGRKIISLQGEYKKLTESAKGFITAQAETHRSANAAILTLGLLEKEIKVGAAADKLVVKTHSAQGIADAFDAFTARQGEFARLERVVSTVRTNISDAISSGNIEKLKEYKTQLSELFANLKTIKADAEINKLVTQSTADLGQTIGALPKLIEAREASQKANQVKAQLDVLLQLIPQIEQQQGKVNTSLAETEVKALSAFNKYTNGARTALGSTKDLIDAQKQFNALLNEQPSPGGPVQNQSRGGRVRYFDQGGFVSRGTDKIPAMLSQGEFVVNPKSSKRFFSDLVAMNAGRSPKYLAEGGPVTNTYNFTGDINVNNPEKGMTGRQTVSEIRREIRRGSSRRP